MTLRLSALRYIALSAALHLGSTVASHALTINDPIALVSEDREAAAHIHKALQRRFQNIVVYDTLTAAQKRFDASGDLKVIIRLTSVRERFTATAYGVSLPTCRVAVTAEVLRLPGPKLEFSKLGEGQGPDCGEALSAADAQLTDELVRSLEEYRRHGVLETEDSLWLELAGDWSDTELVNLRQQLLEIPGIRSIDPDSPPRQLKVEIYREPQALAREINQQAALRVNRFSGNRVTLTRTSSSTLDETTPVPAPAPTGAFLPIDGGAASAFPAPTSSKVHSIERESPFTPSSSTASVANSRGRKWALVVGVSSFADQAIEPLAFPGRDAEAFADVLKDPDIGRFAPDDVVLLLNGDATTRRLKKELDDLARKTHPEDLFVFFFSSHASSGRNDTAGDAYLITHDTEKSNLYATGLPMRELVDVLSQRIRARTVVTFLDACHTGQIVQRSANTFKGAKAVAGTPTNSPELSWSREWKTLLKPLPGRKSAPSPPAGSKRLVFISSSDGDQPSWESERLGHGFFTFYLMKALKQSQGQITVAALFDFLKVEVRRAALSERGAVQEPRMFFNRDADMLVGYAATLGP